jgi:hypothetical protein
MLVVFCTYHAFKFYMFLPDMFVYTVLLRKEAFLSSEISLQNA